MGSIVVEGGEICSPNVGSL